MKSFYLSIIAILLSFHISAKNRIDTVDYWHVFYNGRIIAKYTSWDVNRPIKIKKSLLKNNDVLSVKYGDDTPCDECASSLYLLDKTGKKVFIANVKGTWKLIEVSIKKILDWIELNHQNPINFYYHDNRSDHLIFRLKLE